MHTTADAPASFRSGDWVSHWALRPGVLALLGFSFAALLVSRHPDVLLHAELWGEDGWHWYPDAYDAGVRSLLWSYNGYLHAAPRLVGLAVQPFPLTWVPTLFALAALAVQIAPPLFLVSQRMAVTWPNAGARYLFAFLVVALPNAYEIYVNLTNVQWHLAMLAFLVVVSSPPRQRSGQIFDVVVLLLAGLSGPFCVALLPVALWQAYQRRSRADWRRCAVVLLTAMVQLSCLALTHSPRSFAPLGADPLTLVRIVALQILFGAEIGQHSMEAVLHRDFWTVNAVPTVVTAAGVALALVALWRGPDLLRKTCLFAALVFGASLLSPQVSNEQPQWLAMTAPGMGNRYFVMPMLAWVGVVVTLAADRSRRWRGIGMALLVLMLVYAVPRDWPYPSSPPTTFIAQARAFEQAPPGTRMEFPLNPPGASPMILVKRSP